MSILSIVDKHHLTHLPVNQRLLLDDPKKVWILAAGEGDLFAMKRLPHSTEGPLSFLSSFSSTSILFGISQEEGKQQMALLFISTTPISYYIVSIDEFLSKVTLSEDTQNELEQCFQKWFQSFSPLFALKSIPAQSIHLEPLQEVILEKGTKFCSMRTAQSGHKEDALWLDYKEGLGNIMGMKELEVSKEEGLYPLLPFTWIEVEEKSSLKALAPSEALSHPGIWQGLNSFHLHVQTLLSLKMHTQQENERWRNLHKKELEEKLLSQSFNKMAAVLSPRSDAHLEEESDNPLFQACQRIGNELNLNFIPVNKKNHDFTIDEQVSQLCRNSQIRFRRVTLEEGWWKKDCGPLLGFYGIEQFPVALLNQKSSRYSFIDPFTKQKRNITEEDAQKIAKTGFMFYQPFPEGPLNGIKVAKFCLKDRWKDLGHILLVGGAGSLLSLFTPFASQVIFDRVINGGERVLLPQILIGLVIAAIGLTLFLLTRSYISLRITQLIDAKLECALWDRILDLPANFFRQFTAGNLIQRVYSVNQIHQLISGNMIRILLSGVFSLLYFIAMLYYSTKLAMIGLAIIVSSIIVTVICTSLKLQLQRKILHINGILNGVVVQLISGINKLRVGGAENRAFAYWGNRFTKSQQLLLRSQNIQNFVTLMNAVLPIIALTVLFFSVMSFISSSNENTLTVGTFIAFMAAFVPFSQSIFDSANALISMVTVVPLWERAKVILEETPEVSKNKIKPSAARGQVAINHLSFKYDKSTPLILNEVSFHASPGEFIAIVGPSGSGKSTLVRLLLGFETPTKGSIFYDDQDLASLDLKELRRQIGAVLQQGAIFSGSLHENIVCGGVYTREQIEEVLALCGLSEDIQNFPMGLHTIVQSGGNTLSGGQAQRILIARAMIGKPKLLIFDEATSALDGLTQDLISYNLDQLNVTRIVIAHRLSTIRHADRIYVLDQGKIVDVGTFEELISKGGLFKQMALRQKL